MQRAAIAERTAAPARSWLPPIAFALLLLAYNNLLFGLPGNLAWPSAEIFYPRAVLLPLVATFWAVRVQGFSLAELGITTRNLLPSAAVGLAVTLVITVPAVLYFLFPIGVPGGSVDYENYANDTIGEFTFWAAVRYPIHAVIFEEVLFRGVLFALALRSFGATWAIVLTAATFSGWHVIVDHQTLGASNAADDTAFFVFAQVGSLVALFIGGLIFAVMRWRTGNLAGPIIFHWLSIVAINSTLYAQAR